ncbi:lasso peptide biosynthesis PqqD family chaperone [Alkalicoccus daliensis]|uniref:Coenzyme PQQ synthesis protein D (PqqD) n=1 Tax=Alkalicoccus daliensis TaxID=745820 RepID=A0A1H0G000_9BACI|nr:lasso peptide biosynthesis PqqD family chaperone [Alkalicoccus daliensis]SDO00225.1 Coenzyme PQQ synthesis protein D (PqqD) [Alkalicoccus daliensis]
MAMGALANQYVTQAAGNVVSQMGSEKVMFNTARGKYYNLGETGGEIWDIMAGPVQIKDIVARLQETYNVSESECRYQVEVFLEMMRKEELIVLGE